MNINISVPIKEDSVVDRGWGRGSLHIDSDISDSDLLVLRIDNDTEREIKVDKAEFLKAIEILQIAGKL